MARSTFSPPRKVRSTTAPERTFLSVVRTKAPPLPGLTCWNSTTSNRPSSRSSAMPFFRSLVVIVGIRGFLVQSRARAAAWGRLGGRVLGAVGEGAAPLGRDDDGVLHSDAAVGGKVDPRFDGDHVADGERSIARGAHPGRLVDVEADPV